MPLPSEQPEEAELPHTYWYCEVCEAENSCLDAECQYCDGPAHDDYSDDD